VILDAETKPAVSESGSRAEEVEYPIQGAGGATLEAQLWELADSLSFLQEQTTAPQIQVLAVLCCFG